MPSCSVTDKEKDVTVYGIKFVYISCFPYICCCTIKFNEIVVIKQKTPSF